MNTKMVILTLLAVTVISAAATITMQRLQVAYAFAPFCHNCAKEFAPGQEAKSPGDASNFAPGQEAKIPIFCHNCAKDFAPGQEKTITK
jgi:hypothetical protein